MFYFKIAWNNLKNSLAHYAPFMLASLLLFTLNCSTLLILLSPMGKGMGTGAATLGLGVIVISIFSLIMELYSYKILLKQRSREFGLYNILGMNKRQVGLIASLELGFIFGLLILLGSVFSGIFSKFLYLVFVNIINYHELNLSLSVLPFVLNFIIFGAIFFVLEVTALVHIGKSSPLNLFRKQEQGEKEPRGNIILAALSLLAVGIAYYMSMTSSKVAALAVLYRFFIAVLLVIAGTYLFYISFMTWYLKRRRKNKTYFYQPEHFVSTSQMIFRMKQNATGLASITLLAVMALVTIGTTVSLYTNTQNIANGMFPKNTKITFETQENQAEDYVKTQLLPQLGKSEKDVMTYTTSLISFNLSEDKQITVDENSIKTLDINHLGFIYVMTQDDFRSLGNDLTQLSSNQAAFFKQKGNSKLEHFSWFGQEFDVVKNFQHVIMPEMTVTYNSGVLVVADKEKFQAIIDAYKTYMPKQSTIGTSFATYLDLTKDEVKRISPNGETVGEGKLIGYVQEKEAYLAEGYQLFGGLLFTGFLLGISFILGIALIIYYKQYSEGHEDKKSYRILQEVGMSENQIKKTINSQIVLFFFMPLAIASLHFMVAMPMLRQMLFLFGVTSSNLVYLIGTLTILVIAVIYYTIYRFTSRTYYKIIER